MIASRFQYFKLGPDSYLAFVSRDTEHTKARFPFSLITHIDS